MEKIVNPKAIWIFELAKILKMLESSENMNQVSKIPKHQFERADFAEGKRLLKHKLGDLLHRAKVPLDRNMLCPFHLDRSPSMVFNKGKADLHCFACHDVGKTRDIFDLIGVLSGLKSFSEQRLKAIEILVERVNESTNAKLKNSHSAVIGTDKMERPTSAQKSFSSTKGWYYNHFEDDEDCLRFLEQRGITHDSAKKFKLKYWMYEENKYLVIPCDNQFYTRRKFIKGLCDYPKYWKPKGSTVSLFNGKALEQEHSIVFVLESAIDAITMDQLGFSAIAINGTKHYGLLVQKSDVILNKDVYLIILMDNDADGVGAMAGKEIATVLQAIGVRCYLHCYQKNEYTIADFLTRFKDLNEAYLANPLYTRDAVTELFNMASELRLIRPSETTVIGRKLIPNPLELFGRADNLTQYMKERVINDRRNQ